MQLIIFIVWEHDRCDRHQTPRNHGYFSSPEKAQQYCDVTAISGQSEWHIEAVEVQ
jgi:hypothetical protein